MLVSLSDVLTSEGKVETVAIPLEMTSFKSRQGEFPITEKTLVCEGYLERREAPDDRRKTLLFCTEKAQDVIEKGRMIQSIFKDTLLDGTDETSKEIFFHMLHVMEENMDNILKGAK